MVTVRIWSTVAVLSSWFVASPVIADDLLMRGPKPGTNRLEMRSRSDFMTRDQKPASDQRQPSGTPASAKSAAPTRSASPAMQKGGPIGNANWQAVSANPADPRSAGFSMHRRTEQRDPLAHLDPDSRTAHTGGLWFQNPSGAHNFDFQPATGQQGVAIGVWASPHSDWNSQRPGDDSMTNFAVSPGAWPNSRDWSTPYWNALPGDSGWNNLSRGEIIPLASGGYSSSGW